MRRVSAVAAMVAAVFLGWSAPASAGGSYKADRAVKLDVMGEWAHPDDDTSIIGPCGVWHARYDVKCGIIMVTRGEGGGNAVGQELGPALGLRRENEDRVAHFRSGTVDIFNIDRVDFFYNTSAPLTQYFWGQDETLRRITRIIRMTQPEIYIGFTPSLARRPRQPPAGRPLHLGGREGGGRPERCSPSSSAAANALDTWQVKKVFSGGSTRRHRRHHHGARLHDRLRARPPTNLSTVAGVWTGYESPYLWPPGNVQGQPAGTAKTWAQVAQEGTRAYPTQSRVMWQGLQAPGCSRFGMTDAYVPFQPNANPAAGRDDAILYGAVRPDPGGLPLGTLEYLTVSDFVNAPGAPFEVTLHVKSGRRTLPRGTAALTVPEGWSVSRAAADRPDLEPPRVDGDVHGDAAAPDRRGQHQPPHLRAAHHRRRHRLHRHRRARRAAGRGQVRALGQVGGVRLLADRHRAARPARRLLGGRAVDRHGRDARPCRSRSTTGRPRRRPATSS